MGLSKEQVERHIAGVEKRLGSAQEVSISMTGMVECSIYMYVCSSVHVHTLSSFQRAHHGYEFARLCVEVQKHSEAIK